MTDRRSLSPAAEPCLYRAYPSSQKGGTLIAEDVWDLAAHEARLEELDGYRPAACLRCGAKLHVHDLRPRVLRGEDAAATEVVRFSCADRARCGAVWRVTPAFLARWLHGTWSRVAKVLGGRTSASVPARTQRRWRERLASSDRQAVAVLSTAEGFWSGLATRVGLNACRIELVREYATTAAASGERALAELAAVLHRLSRRAATGLVRSESQDAISRVHWPRGNAGQSEGPRAAESLSRKPLRRGRSHGSPGPRNPVGLSSP